MEGLLARPDPENLSLLQEHSLTSVLQAELERLIFEGRIKVGERINESTLAAQFKTSRGPLREALRALGEQGLIEFERNRGAFVRQVSLEEAEELYDLRAALDDEVGRKVAGRLNRAQLGALEKLVISMDGDIRHHDIKSYYANNLRFHDALLDYAGNRQLADVYRRVVKGLHLFRLRGLYSDGAAEMSNAEHALVLKAVQVGDAEAAGHAMRGHIEAARLRMRRAVKAATQESPKKRKAPVAS
ncbi:MAG TPA: FCD domain-containing protein [Usitatibacter sp.]|jgi:phosphonate utilization transcriptional regulator|nr:FCD domain-containing protein [Usitatibacter sp.]